MVVSLAGATDSFLFAAARASRFESTVVVVARRGQNASAPSVCICSLCSLRLAPVSRCLPHSLAGSLARPGQRRASLAPHGGARYPTLAAIGAKVRIPLPTFLGTWLACKKNANQWRT